MPTDNHALNTPGKGEQDWDVPLIQNYEQLDIIVEIRDTAANQTNYEPKDGAKYVATDTGVISLGDGTTWNDVGDIHANIDDSERDLQPEGPETGLVADATGVQYTAITDQLLDGRLLDGARSVYLEAATDSSAGDEEVTVEVYDQTAAVVAASHAITGGSRRSRSADISGALTAGNEVTVQYNVTTASGTAGATFDALTARLIVE